MLEPYPGLHEQVIGHVLERLSGCCTGVTVDIYERGREAYTSTAKPSSARHLIATRHYRLTIVGKKQATIMCVRSHDARFPYLLDSALI